MRIAAALSALTLLAAPVSPTWAQDEGPPPQIALWPLERIIDTGREIHRHDTAAWVATDAILEHFGSNLPTGMGGWIVVPDGEALLVRFIGIDSDGPHAAWDVKVEDGRAGSVVAATDRELPADHRTRFLARQTAAANMGGLRCGQRYNSVVLKDTEGDGWLVWLLASTSQANILPMNGHYRFRISADGERVIARDQLALGCLDMDKTAVGPNGQTAALVTNSVVSTLPNETHVFLSMQHRMPLYIMAGGTLYAIEGDKVREVDMRR